MHEIFTHDGVFAGLDILIDICPNSFVGGSIEGLPVIEEVIDGLLLGHE